MVESLRDCKPVLKEHLRLLEKDLRGLEPVPRTQGPQLPAGYQTFDPTTIPHGLSEARRASECVEELLLGFKKEAPLLWYRISATALDLTGSIRTFCRVHREALGTRHPSVEVREPNQLKVKGRPTTNSGLDHVFGPGARGEEIVAELRPHIRILLDQTNVHLFCYGTSDSAQTQTLFGPKAQQEQGIVHLLLEDAYHLVHDIVNRYEQLGKLTMSSFNIERDKVRDCLNGQVLGSNARSLLQEVVVSDLEQGRKFLDQASANRQKHARPSTSHFGIRWTLGLDRSPADTVSFTIVDLANGGKKASGQDSSIDTVESKGVRGDLENLHLVINGLSRGDGATRVGDSTVSTPIRSTFVSLNKYQHDD